MVLQTKAFLTDDGQIKSNRGQKYSKFIEPIYDEYRLKEKSSEVMEELNDFAKFKKRRQEQLEQRRSSSPSSGKGLKFSSNEPNELVNRLRILTRKYYAGNTDVFNEIHAIHNELKRKKYI